MATTEFNPWSFESDTFENDLLKKFDFIPHQSDKVLYLFLCVLKI